jgi:hypothetical protein
VDLDSLNPDPDPAFQGNPGNQNSAARIFQFYSLIHNTVAGTRSHSSYGGIFCAYKIEKNHLTNKESKDHCSGFRSIYPYTFEHKSKISEFSLKINKQNIIESNKKFKKYVIFDLVPTKNFCQS